MDTELDYSRREDDREMTTESEIYLFCTAYFPEYIEQTEKSQFYSLVVTSILCGAYAFISILIFARVNNRIKDFKFAFVLSNMQIILNLALLALLYTYNDQAGNITFLMEQLQLFSIPLLYYILYKLHAVYYTLTEPIRAKRRV